MVALNVARELRGGAHVSAVQAAGLTPHRAIIPSRAGAAGPNSE
ncbi:MAG: helix-turn-helix domain-containing protein [Acidimicrobiales bacterium]